MEYLKTDMKCKKHELKQLQRQQNKVLVKEYRKFFWFLDIVVVLILMSNFGAIALTQIMLTEDNYEKGIEPQHFEVNPVAAAVGDFKTLEEVAKEQGMTVQQVEQKQKEVNRMIKLAIFAGFYWVVLITLYIWQRTHIHSPYQLLMLTFVIAWYFTLMGMDFWNNFGLWIGDVMFR